MVDVILSWPDPKRPQDAAPEMPGAMFDKLLTWLENEVHGQLILHADWRNPPAYLEAALQRLSRSALHVKACFFNHLPLDWLRRVLETGGSVILSGHSLGRLPLTEVADLFRASAPGRPAMAELFLALPRPDFNLPDIQAACHAGLPLQNVILGVGWPDFYAGPHPIPDPERSAWARSLEQAVTRLTRWGLASRLACGLPLCLFSNEQLGRLAKRKIRLPLAHCAPGVMIAPDGALRACQRLGLPQPQIPGANAPLNQITAAITQWLKPFRSLCPQAEQLVCRSAICGACGCGCLAEILGMWNKPN